MAWDQPRFLLKSLARDDASDSSASDLLDLLKPHLSRPITRRTLLAAPPVIAASAVALPALANEEDDNSHPDESISFTLSEDENTVTINVWDAATVGDNAADQGDVWALEKRAFGEKAKFSLYPGAQYGKQVIDANRVRLTITGVVYGRNPAASLSLDFERRIQAKSSRWYISALTSVWGHGVGATPGRPAFTKLGGSSGVLLANFIRGTATLDGAQDAAAIRASLARIFNNLLDVAPLAARKVYHKSEEPEHTGHTHAEPKDGARDVAIKIVKPALSGAMGLRLSANLIWEIRSGENAVLRPVLPEMAAQTISIGRVVTATNRAEEEERESERENNVQILAIPTGVVPAKRFVLSKKPGENISPLEDHEGQTIDLSGLKFHVHDANQYDDEKNPQPSKTFTFAGRKGMARCCLRAFATNETSAAGNSKPRLHHAQAVIAGQWDVAVQKGHNARAGMIAGPVNRLDGVLSRFWTAKLSDRTDKPVKEGEVLTFAAAARAEGGAKIDQEEIITPVGPMVVSALPLGLSADSETEREKKKSEKKGLKFSTYVEEPFDDYRGSPIWLKSASESFNTGIDHDRHVSWMEMRMLVHQSAIALPDASDSHLSFDNTEVAFFHRRQEDNFLPRSFVRLNKRPEAAVEGDAIIVSPNDDSSMLARIDLSGATIKAARHRDLISLKFNFDKLFLKIDPGARIVPESLACGIYEHGFNHFAMSKPSENTNEEEGASTDRLPVAEVKDTRPLLVVEFPPQHLFEEAFFHRSLPISPDVDLADFTHKDLKPFLKIGANGESITADPQADRSIPPGEEKTVIGVIDMRSPDEIISLLDTITGAENRKRIRTKIWELKTGAAWPDAAGEAIPTPLQTQIKEFKRYGSKFENRVSAENLNFTESLKTAVDQNIYIGPYAMDPDVAEIDRKLRNDEQKLFVTKILATAFRQVDDNLRSLSEKAQTELDNNAQLINDPALQQAIRKRIDKSIPPADVKPVDLLALEVYLESGVPVYQLFRNFYRDERLKAAEKSGEMPVSNSEGMEFLFPGLVDGLDFVTPDWVGLAGSYVDNPLFSSRTLLKKALTTFGKEIEQKDRYAEHARGRLSNPSKLAFRINCRDGLVDARNAATAGSSVLPMEQGKMWTAPHSNGVDSIPFSLDGLTNWAAMELSVVRRAEQVFVAPPGGRLDQNSNRKINLHGAAILDHLGFAPGADNDDRTWAIRANRIVSSLMDPPSWDHTALEIPARLVMSPSQQAIFRAPSGVNKEIYKTIPQLVKPVDAYGAPQTRAAAPSVFDKKAIFPSTLWETRMMLGKDIPSPGLRAVHSPDLAQKAVLKLYGSAERFKGSLNQPVSSFGPPPRGPRAPWFLSGSSTGQAAISPADYARNVNKHAGNEALKNAIDSADPTDPNSDDEAVCRTENDKYEFANVLPSRFIDLCRDWLRPKSSDQKLEFRSSLDAYDRHELVMLTSAYGLPVMPRDGAVGDATTRQSSQFVPDDEYLLKDVMPEQEIYRPRTLDVAMLSLSSLGATFEHDTSFIPPASARFENGENLFDALSIENWQHAISFGRDVHSEVVYKGYLCPFGFKASLVKVTERIFAKAPSGRFKAYLRQRMFIRCSNTVKVFGAIGQPFQGRRFPGRNVRLVTDKTPDIVDPTSIYPKNNDTDVFEQATGRLVFRNSPGLVFWPRTAMARSADIRFTVEIEKAYANCPMIFIDNTAANDPKTMKVLADYYNDCLENTVGVESPDIPPCFPRAGVGTNFEKPKSVNPAHHRRTLLMGGAKLRYADEKKSGSSSLATDAITLRLEGREAAAPNLQSADKSSPILAFQNTKYAFDAVLQGADQPPFYPALDTARIRLTSVSQLTGNPVEPVRAAYDGHYISAGFPAVSQEDESAEVVAQQKQEEAKNGRGANNPGPEEVFLNLIDGVSQSMGNKGEQSGGVYRPEGVIKAISRTKGPIALNTNVKPAQLSKGDLPAFSTSLDYKKPKPPPNGGDDQPQPPAPSPQVPPSVSKTSAYSFSKPDEDEMLKAIFGDAELLGIIPFTKIIEFATGLLLENAPKLVESIEYGVAQIEGAADDISTFIRENVLVPLANVMQRANGEWERLDADLAKRQKSRLTDTVNFEPITLAELFPEIDASLEAFANALVNASRETDPVKLYSLLGQVYETGQQFLDGLRRAASDPVERFEDALQSRFDEVRDTIDRLRNLLTGQLDLLLDTIRERAAKELVRILTSADEQQVLFALPLPTIGVQLLNEDQRGQLMDAVKVDGNDLKIVLEPLIAALFDGKDPLKDSTFLEVAKKRLNAKKNQAIQAIESGIENVEEAVRERIETEINDAVVIFTLLAANIEDVINDEIDALIAKAEAEFDNQAAKLIPQFLVVYEEVQAIVAHVERAKSLWERLETSLKKRQLPEALSSAQALVSHVSGQNISLVPPQVSEAAKEVRSVLITTLEALPFDKLGFIALTDKLENPCEVPADVAALDSKIIALLPDGTMGTFPRQIAEWHSDLVTAHENLSGSNRTTIEDGLKKLPERLQERTTLALKKVDDTTLAAHKALTGMFCDVVNDADALGALELRRTALVVALKDGNTPPEMVIASFKTLRADLKQLVASRKLVVKRTIDNVEALMKTATDFLVTVDDKDALVGIMGALVVESTYMEQGQTAAQNALIQLAAPINKGVETSLLAADLVLAGMEDIVRALRAFVARIANSTNNTIQLIALDEFAKEKPAKIGVIVEKIGELRKLLQSEMLEPPSLKSDSTPETINKLKDYYEGLERNDLSTDLRTSFDTIETMVTKDLRECLDLTKLAERAVKSILSQFESKLFRAADKPAKDLLDTLGLASLYGRLAKARGELLGNNIGGTLAGSFLLLPPDPADRRGSVGTYVRPAEGEALSNTNDRLAADAAWLAEVAKGTAISSAANRAYLGQFIKEWSRAESTPVLLIEGLVDRVQALLKGDVDLLELFQVQQQVETYLLNLIPSKHKFDLDVNLPLSSSVAKATGGIFSPGDDCELRVGAVTEIDLLPNGIDLDNPKVTAKALATLGSFEIKLVGTFFDALTMQFSGARFESDFSESDFKLYFLDVVIGPQLEFIESLQALMTPSEGSGVFIKPLRGMPGIEAGYGLNLGNFMIGNVAFGNISLNASTVLPFDGGSDSRALFKASLSRSDAPFTIAYIPFGGSGYFEITADAKGIIGFEMSLEFGGAAPFKAGPLTGMGRIMAGFFIRQIKLNDVRVTEIYATFFAGGSASIWIFNFSASLYLRLGQAAGGAMSGLAIFSFSFSAGLVDFDYSVRFEKKEDKGFEGNGDENATPKQTASLNLSRPRFAEHDGSFIKTASNRPIDIDYKIDRPKITNLTQCQSCKWQKYTSYFDTSIEF